MKSAGTQINSNTRKRRFESTAYDENGNEIHEEDIKNVMFAHQLKMEDHHMVPTETFLRKMSN
jgi:hypothetical protein